ncbi:hypothetical protein WR25_14151 [Diploscapter pachys]|uniref:ubiquitinyl hydrolase 1 n=1 Tax=Diploscapter pachys TaxID=2018661 RepID=A0A2A2LSJ5_9BILA|nr:hypothetical protein WR25_14151 [Diploscapter pachys]
MAFSFSSSSYRYSGSSGVSATRPSVRSSSGSSRTTGASAAAAEPSSYSSSSYLPRSSSSSSYYRQPYMSPAASRIGAAATTNPPAASSMSMTKTPASPLLSSRYSRTSNANSSYSSAAQTPARDALSRMTPSAMTNGASSSMLPPGSSNPLTVSPTPDQHLKINRLARNSYRTVSVSQYAQQAKEREEREIKLREQIEWEEREKFREQSEGLMQPSVGSFVSDFRSRSTFASPAYNEFTRSIHSYDPNYLSSSSSTNSRDQQKDRDRDRDRERASTTAPVANHNSYAAAAASQNNQQITPGTGPRGGSVSALSTSPSASVFTNSHLQLGGSGTRSLLHPAGAPGIPPPPPPPQEGARIPIQHSASVYAVSSYKPYQRHDQRQQEEAATGSVALGFTGLRNIGNTCFMNATLQMLVNSIELKTYFLERHYQNDINIENPLGFKGRLAEAFAEFMREMWNQRNRAIEPAKIKELVAEKANQFANFSQHDAHEFLSFLLDGLHEDLNRVKRKPQTGIVESDGRGDVEVADEAWRNHTLRNDSIFVDLFYGQLKSRLQCPACDRISITFDPFVYLPVPFPKVKKSSTVYFWPLDPYEKPIKMAVFYSADGTIQDLITALSDMVRVPSRQIRFVEVLSHRFQKFFEPQEPANDISSGDTLFAFQVHDPNKCGDEVVEIKVLQRQLYLSNSKYVCNHCGSSRELRLKACEGCYNAYYCNKDCQQSDWNTGGHRDECGRRTTGPHAAMRINGSTPSDSSVRAASKSPARKSPSREASNSSNRSTTPSQSKQMFLIKKIRDQTVVLGDTISEKETEGLVNVENGAWLSVNWYNLRNGKPFITVINKRQLDCDVDKSAKFCRSTSSEGRGTTAEPTLQEMLGLFSETEKLKPEEAWYCNKCKQHVEATKKLELYRLPPVLIVQLKRFVYTASAYQTSMHRRSKDERRVLYPIYELDMAPYLAESAPSDQTTKYDLTGVICHSGSSFFGHYVSIGRLAGLDGSKTVLDWRLFDDSMVTKTSVSNVQSDDAYLLFYKQRGLATKRIFTKHYSCDPTELNKPDVNEPGPNPLKTEHPASFAQNARKSATPPEPAIIVNGTMHADTNGNPMIKIDKESSPECLAKL